MIDKIFDIL